MGRGRLDFADKNVPIELEKLDQPLLGLDAVRGQIEELAVLLHDKKLSQVKSVVYVVSDHSGASCTPAVWTLCDWQENKDVLVESLFEDPEGNGPVR